MIVGLGDSSQRRVTPHSPEREIVGNEVILLLLLGEKGGYLLTRRTTFLLHHDEREHTKKNPTTSGGNKICKCYSHPFFLFVIADFISMHLVW